MPIDNIAQQTNSMNELSSMPTQGANLGANTGADPGAVQGTTPGAVQGMGGPGVDTPQEKQAVEMLMKAAQLMRQSAEADPSIKPLIDTMLQDSFLKITDHYGVGEEGKTALKQAQLGQGRERATALSGGPPTQGPPNASQAINY